MNANFSSEKELKNTKRTAEKRSKSSKKAKLKNNVSDNSYIKDWQTFGVKI